MIFDASMRCVSQTPAPNGNSDPGGSGSTWKATFSPRASTSTPAMMRFRPFPTISIFWTGSCVASIGSIMIGGRPGMSSLRRARKRARNSPSISQVRAAIWSSDAMVPLEPGTGWRLHFSQHSYTSASRRTILPVSGCLVIVSPVFTVGRRPVDTIAFAKASTTRRCQADE